MSGETLDTRREQLYAAADAFVAQGKSQEAQRALCESASAYHIARAETFRTQYAAGGKGDTNGAGAKYVIPWGKTKGTPIGEATEKDLNYILGRLKESLDDPDRQNFRAKNAALIAAIEAELETR